jgi:hypothetical protein
MPTPISDVIEGRLHGLAGRGEHYQYTDLIEPGDYAPPRRFVRGGSFGDVWFLNYESGGVGYFRTTVVFRLNSDTGEVTTLMSAEYGNLVACEVVDSMLDGQMPKEATPSRLW